MLKFIDLIIWRYENGFITNLCLSQNICRANYWLNKICIVCLPLQVTLFPHFLVSYIWPVHSFPPFSGVGLLHSLVLVCTPHLDWHTLHVVHSDKPPSTEKKKTWKLKWASMLFSLFLVWLLLKIISTKCISWLLEDVFCSFIIIIQYYAFYFNIPNNNCKENIVGRGSSQSTSYFGSVPCKDICKY